MRTSVVLLALAALAALTPARAATAPLALVADLPDPAPGSIVTLDVELGPLQIGCFSFSVEYDPSVLEYLGAEEGPLFSGAPELTYFSDDVDDQGRPQPNDCLLGFGTSVAGPGSIARLRFSVLEDLATTVALRDPVLRDVDRLPLPGIPEVELALGTTTTSSPVPPAAGSLSAYPNPSSSRLSFVLSGRAFARPGRLSIFDLAGRLVRELDWPAGAQSLGWDGRDLAGRPVANGIYHARLQAGNHRVQTRIVRVK